MADQRLDPRSFNQRLSDAGIAVERTDETDRMGRAIAYLVFGKKRIRRPTVDFVVDVCKAEFGVEI